MWQLFPIVAGFEVFNLLEITHSGLEGFQAGVFPQQLAEFVSRSTKRENKTVNVEEEGRLLFG